MGTRIAGDYRDYLHYTKDDDFTVDLHSNDVNAVRVSPDASVRAHWRLKLPLTLEIPQKEYEVAVAKFTCRNHQTNSPKSVRLLEKGSKNVVVERPLPAERYSTEGDLLMAIYEVLDGGEMLPKLPKFSKEELYLVAVRNDKNLYAFTDLTAFAMPYIVDIRAGTNFTVHHFWDQCIRNVLYWRNTIEWREIPNAQGKVLDTLKRAHVFKKYHVVKTEKADWLYTWRWWDTLGNMDHAGTHNYLICSQELALALHLDSNARISAAYQFATTESSAIRDSDKRVLHYVTSGAIFAPTMRDSSLTMTTPKPFIRMVKDQNFISMENRDGGDVVLVSRDEKIQTSVFCNFKISHAEFFERCLRPISYIDMSALERPVACVNLEIGGLPFLSRIHTPVSAQDDVLLMSNVALEGETVTHIPLKNNRFYRELDDVERTILDGTFG